jgi:putative nucleotidyltransferase with HDIG domain
MATAKGLLLQFTSMKTLPHVAIRLSKLISDENSAMVDFEEVIKLDPTLVLRLLKLANSPFYGLRNKVSSIPRIVVLIGTKTLRNMVVVEALKEIFKTQGGERVFSRNKLWLHSAAVSIMAKMVAERVFQKESEDPFLCGILHDVGIIVEDSVVPELLDEVLTRFVPGGTPLIELEREIIGTEHSEVGALLAEDWKLPKVVSEAVGGHHANRRNVAPDSVGGIVQIANFMASKMNYSMLDGRMPSPSPEVAMHIKNNLDEYRVLAKDFPAEMEKARELYEME